MEHVYIHIPFCKSICSYCDFCKLLYDEKNILTYLDSLEREVNDFYQNEIIKTIYIGGGTPSSLKISELVRLFKIIKIFKKSENIEFTFEINPEDINRELISLLKSNGVNRLSIGVESFNSDKLKFMERNASYDDIKQKIAMIREMDINNINLDLMYGLPSENTLILKNDLRKILSLKPEHISTYSLIIEDNTKLKIRHTEYIDEELDYKMYKLITKTLETYGYKHYEVSNFAKPGYESIHNLGYWNNHEYYGFGLGASGYFSGFRYENTHNLDKYNQGNYRHQTELLSKKEVMEYELMLGLRKMDGVNIDEFNRKFEVKIEECFPIKPLIKSRELLLRNNYLCINPQMIYVMNEILLKMI